MEKLGIKIALDVRRKKIGNDIDRFNELSCFIENALKEEEIRRKSFLSQKIIDMNDENEATLMCEFYAEDIFQIERDFPRLQRYALFVSLMSILESNLIGFCKTAKRLLSISKDFNSRKPLIIKRSMEYLEKEAKIDTSQFNGLISMALSLNCIRNCIVHSEGSIKKRKDSEEITNFIKGKEIISLDPNDKIILNEEFLVVYSQEMSNLLKLMLTEIGKKVIHQND